MKRIDTTLSAETIAAALITEYRLRDYAIIKIGDVEVRIDDAFTRPATARVEINWPGIGAQNAKRALSFAADLTRASLIALHAETLIDEALAAEATEGA